jgi:hypothetical protein
VSGSLVLFTAAVFAGVYDAELLTCMFVMTAVCMLLGIVSEFCLRAHLAMTYTISLVKINTYIDDNGRPQPSILDRELPQEPEESSLRSFDLITGPQVCSVRRRLTPISPFLRKKGDTQVESLDDVLHPKKYAITILNSITENSLDKIRLAALYSHVLGWICILVPWIIVMIRYSAWKEPCEIYSEKTKSLFMSLFGPSATQTNESTADTPSNGPPDFVIWIVSLEFIFFFFFGVVQAIQLRQLWNENFRISNNLVEFMYITLSAAAKLFIGIMLFFFALFQ